MCCRGKMATRQQWQLPSLLPARASGGGGDRRRIGGARRVGLGSKVEQGRPRLWCVVTMLAEWVQRGVFTHGCHGGVTGDNQVQMMIGSSLLFDHDLSSVTRPS